MLAGRTVFAGLHRNNPPQPNAAASSMQGQASQRVTESRIVAQAGGERAADESVATGDQDIHPRLIFVVPPACSLTFVRQPPLSRTSPADTRNIHIPAGARSVPFGGIAACSLSTAA